MNLPATAVSVIFITHEQEQATTQCLSTFFEHNRQRPHEVIVVDVGSKNTNPFTYAEKFPLRLLIRLHSNIGYARACLIALHYTCYPYAIFANNDLIFTEDAVDACASLLDREPAVAAVTCKIVNPDGTPQHVCQPFPTIGRIMAHLVRLPRWAPRKAATYLWGPFFTYDRVAYPDWIWGTFFMVRKQALKFLPRQKLAHPPERMYYDDILWCWQFRQVGFRCAFTPRAQIIHLQSLTSGFKHADALKKRTFRRLEKWFIVSTRGRLYWLVWHVLSTIHRLTLLRRQ